jgi:heme oxygenase
MPTPPARGGALRANLREATQSLHDRVEATNLMGRLTRDDLTADAYAETLRILASIHQPLETALARVEGLRDVLPDLDQRFKTASIAKDLEAMGQRLDATPVDLGAADPRDVPAALGVLYVLEGSTMGARVIARMLKTRPFVTKDVLHFFEHYGDQAGPSWQRLLAVLENVTPNDHPAVIQAALGTFDVFLQAAAPKNATQP